MRGSVIRLRTHSRCLSTVALMVIVFALAPGCGQKPAEPKGPMNVVVIVADSVRSDHLNAYGYGRETTPNLAAMAAKGALFKDCISQATGPTASVASILTSLYPSSHTALADGSRLPDEAETAAELFQKAGYVTLGASGLPAASNLRQGFGTFIEISLADPNSISNLVQQTLVWLEQHKTGPFFVFLHLRGPLSHDFAPGNNTWAEPDKLKRYRERLSAFKDRNNRCLPTREELEKAQIDPVQFSADAADVYDDSLHGMDSEIGRLVAGLDTLGVRDKTVVVFTGSFGQEFVGRPGKPCGSNVYGEVANVPLLIAGPAGVRPGAVLSETVQTIDVLPTLLDMNGLPVPESVQGTSLLQSMTGDNAAASVLGSRPAITESSSDTTSNVSAFSCAVAADGWKLVQNGDPSGGQAVFELFDRGKDLLDTSNIAGANPEVVEKLKSELTGWRERVNSARLTAESAPSAGPESETVEQLKSLPYF